jgi:hypothetical protein
MKDWMRANPLLALMAITGFMLAVVIGLEVAFGSSLAKALETGETRQGIPADAKLLPSLVAVGPEQAYPETVARPLFIPTRRPAPDAPPVAATALQKGQFVLQGTIVVGENRVAMLREKSSGKVVRVEQGKEFNGMKVVSIEKEAVTLGVGADEEKLVLNVVKPTGAAAAASPGPFAPATPAPAPAGGLPVPGQTGAGPAPVPAPNPAGAPPLANPAARPMPDPTAAGNTPLTPEELAARRRAARRGQQQN